MKTVNKIFGSNSFFKYYRMDDNRKDWIKDLLCNNIIYFSAPEEFNDPFDCQVNMSFSGTNEELMKYYVNLLKGKYPNTLISQIEEFTKKLIDEGKLQDINIQKSIINYVQNSLNSIGILCLTKNPNSLLMWSHYAYNHTGICVQFKLDEKRKTFLHHAKEVNYITTYPTVNLIIENPQNLAKLMLLSKSSDWKYENEWRVILLDFYGPQDVGETFIEGIILGCKMPNKNKELIIEWIERNQLTINLFQAVRKKDKFGLDIVKFRPELHLF